MGSVVNWWLGLYLAQYENSRWFPCSPEQLHRAQRRFQQYGSWSLLLAWLPAVGDGLTLAAGVMKMRLLPFVLLVSTGKGGRYAVVIVAFQKAAAVT